jgi:hypothetical protein
LVIKNEAHFELWQIDGRFFAKSRSTIIVKGDMSDPPSKRNPVPLPSSGITGLKRDASNPIWLVALVNAICFSLRKRFKDVA